MLVISLNALELLLYKTPNGIFIASAMVVGFLLSTLVIRLVFIFTANAKMWPSPETARAAWILNIYRFVAACSFLCSLILMGRIQSGTVLSIFNTTYFNKGLWNAARILAELLALVCSGLANTNPLFRMYPAIAYPALGLIDMLSELDLAGFLNCDRLGICHTGPPTWNLTFWILRDCIGLFFDVSGSVFAWFLWGTLGFFTNDVYIPSYEHRFLSYDLKRKAVRRKIKRRLGDNPVVEW